MIPLKDALDALGRAFFVRFFESEITSGTDDLKGSFFWLLAALAVPGLFIPWSRVFDWQGLALMGGPEAVRMASRADKVFYLGFSLVASGILTTIAWGSLLPDKRDTLILGSLPVKPSTVVAAKLFALLAYVGLVALFMHGVGALFWGFLLAHRAPFTFVFRGAIAHFVAAAAASMAVCVAVAAAQGLLLALVGPRAFRPASTVLQVLVVGLLALCLATIPVVTTSVVGTLAHGPTAQPWILMMPAVWFLGLYEQLLGTPDPLLLELARRAWITLGLALLAAIVTYPLAYRRLMVSVVETGSEPRNPVARGIHALLVMAAGRSAQARATAQFFTATLARVDQQRFVLAIAFGIAIAWTLPGGVPSTSQPSAPLLALPLASMMFMLVGLRVASSLPADVRAAWVFEVHDVSREHARQALERMMFVLAVMPAIVLSAPVFWRLWGGGVALTHACVMAAIGIALIELLIWHCNSMPCGQPLVPARADFGRRWPLHLAIFLVVVSSLPKLEVVLFRHPAAAALFVACLLIVAFAIRYVSGRHQIVPIHEDVDPVAGVLRLN